MNITLPAELERRVHESVRHGDYEDANALIQEAVQRLIDEDSGSVDAIRACLNLAEAEIDRGEGLDFNEQTTEHLVKEIHTRGLRRLADLQKSGRQV